MTSSETAVSATGAILDDALAEFHRYRDEYAGGMTSHGPMVVESLEHAGLDENIAAWTTSYTSHLEPRTPANPPTDRPLRIGHDGPEAWTAHFVSELEARSWQDVVVEWAPALVPGSVGAAGHGILRAAHAVRSLGRLESPARLAELAHGLGYWAATSYVLPGRPTTGDATLPHALEAVPATVSSAFFISDRMSDIDGRTFGPAVAAAALPSDADDALTAVIDLAARVLATNSEGAIAFVHAVTVPSCARHLLPFVDDAGRSAVADQAWWVLAAMWSAYGRHAPLSSAPADAPTWDELTAAALRSGDEHDIKLTIAARDQADRVEDLLLRAAVATVVTGA